ncbi:S-layer homology domain-containing protein [Paenibacillus sp. FSL H8-0280]|uniref:S-layer homology domain-containing protein n=1 Tax=Paenibacillus sp. FSL H8-0280 TaxID=2921382 RepID=UPI003870AC21
MNNGAVISSYTPYQDNNEVSLWACAGVDLVSQESIMKGYPNQKFMTKRDLTREEAAMIIYNLIQWNK